MTDRESNRGPLSAPDRFVDRHVGPDAEEIGRMLSALDLSSLDQLIDEAIPIPSANS